MFNRMQPWKLIEFGELFSIGGRKMQFVRVLIRYVIWSISLNLTEKISIEAEWDNNNSWRDFIKRHTKLSIPSLITGFFLA